MRIKLIVLLLSFSSASLAEAVFSEVSVQVADEHIMKALEAFELKSDTAKKSRLLFFDNKKLDLHNAGLHLNGTAVAQDSFVSVRAKGLSPEAVGSLVDIKGMRCEAEEQGAKVVGVCRFQAPIEEAKLKQVYDKQLTIQEVYPEELRNFAQTFLKKSINWSELRVYGPIKSWLWTKKANNGIDINIELWVLGEVKILDLMVRVPPPERKKYREGLRSLLAKYQVEENHRPSPKIGTVLGLMSANDGSKQ